MENVRDIVFSAPLWYQLRRHLLGSAPNKLWQSPDEQLAFVLASYNKTSSGIRLVARELLLAAKQDLAHQSAGSIGPTGEFVAKALTRCRTEGWSLIEAHSHPFDSGDNTTFSGIDWANDRAKMPQLAAMMPPPFFHATMVLGQAALDAHCYDQTTSAIVRVPRIVVVGAAHEQQRPLAHIRTTSSDLPSLYEAEERHDRQLPLLGIETQAFLSRTSIAIVGLGGLGSFAALELAHLGVGHLVLIDPDSIDVTNLNRLVGATAADVGKPKVSFYAKLLSSIAPDSRVTAVRAEIMAPEALELAKSADVLLGCVDSHGARLTLNHLSIRYLIPLLDAGTGIRLGDRDPRVGGQVQLVTPGLGCLECRGFIDARQAAFELETQDFQEYERSHGYGIADAAPSVILLNGVVASLQVSETVRLLGGLPNSGPYNPIVMYEAVAQRSFAARSQRVDDCATCGPDGVVGVADLAPLRPVTRGTLPPARTTLSSTRPGSNSFAKRLFRAVRRIAVPVARRTTAAAKTDPPKSMPGPR